MAFFILTFLTIATITYSLSILVGFLFAKQTKTSINNDTNYILHSFWGLCIIVLLYSTLLTFGKTINIFLIIPLIIFWTTKKTKIDFNLNRRKLLLSSMKFAMIFLILFIISIFWNYNVYVNNDILYYSNIGKNLSNGIENPFHYFNSLIKEEKNGLFPYHYFEFWFLSIIDNFTKQIPAAIVLKYLIYVYFKTYIILGIDSILQYLNRKSIYNIVFIILFSLIPYEMYINIFNDGWPYFMNIWEKPNFLVYLFTFIPFIIYTLKKEYFFSVISLIILPIICTIAAPSIFLFIPFYIFSLLLLKLITKKEALILVATTLLTAILILTFYKFYSIELHNLKLTKELLISKYSVSWKAIIRYIIILPLGLLALLGPLYFVYSYVERKNKQLLLIIFSGVLISAFGVVIAQLGYFLDNFYQFPFVGYSFIYLIATIILSILISSKNILIKTLSALILLVGLFFSKKNITIPKEKNLIINSLMHSQFENKNTIIKKETYQLLLDNKENIKGRGFLF